MFNHLFFFAAGTALISSVHAHMAMREPVPYTGNIQGELYPVTSPLSGGQYPCQFGVNGPYTQKGTSVAAGSSVDLAFTGSAQHGGGSCQVSLFNLGSSSTVSTNPSDWKVIHTILGGCPGTGAEATPNGTDPVGRPDGAHCSNNNQTNCSRTFSIPINEQVPAGNYVFAWSWFNKIGNREMYMNCAPMTITGGSGNASYFSSLPAMFIANIPEAGCTTVETYSPLLPNPGSSVEVFNSTDDNVSVLGLGTCKAATGSSAVTTLPPQPSSTAVSAAPVAASEVPVASPATSTVNSGPTTTESPADSASCANPCSTDGAIVCLPNNQFGICNFGCAVAQSLAAGTTCSNGQIAKRFVPVRFGRAHS